jgi:uncharacterized membrane protein YkvA (DUF1232 family)
MKDLWVNGRLAWRLIHDRRVPAWIKIGVPLLVIVYVVSPVDLIPDSLIGPGQLDDMGVVLLGISLIVRLSPQDVVDEHKRALGYQVDGSAHAGAGNSGGRSYWAPPGSGGSGETQPSSQQGQAAIDGEYRVITPESGRPYAN